MRICTCPSICRGQRHGLLCRGQRRGILWRWSYQWLLSLARMLGTKLGSFGGTVSALNCWVVSPAHSGLFQSSSYLEMNIEVFMVWQWHFLYNALGNQREWNTLNIDKRLIISSLMRLICQGFIRQSGGSAFLWNVWQSHFQILQYLIYLKSVKACWHGIHQLES